MSPQRTLQMKKKLWTLTWEDAPDRVIEVLWERDLNHKGESVHC